MSLCVTTFLKQVFVMNKYDFNCCRICLSYNNLTSIFGMDGDKRISEKVTFCASVQVRENDGLPPNICQQCKFYLNRAFVFKTVCEVTNEKLLQLLNERRSDVEETNLEAKQDGHNFETNRKTQITDQNSNESETKIETLLREPKQETVVENQSENVAFFDGSSPDRFVCGDDVFVDKVSNVDVNEVLIYSDLFVEAADDKSLEAAKTTKVGRHIAKKNAGQHPRKLHRTENTDVVHETDLRRSKCAETKRPLMKVRKKKKTKLEVVESAENVKSSTKFTCEVCKKGFPYRSHLLRHLNTHTGLKRHTCEYCNKAFVNNYNLSEHLRKHTGDFPLKCDVCGKGFSSPSILKRHARSHTGELPYQCKYCHKKFGHSSSRKLHEKMHSHRPVYKCDVCHKSFTYTNSLLAHRKTHTNFKPHSCSVCKKSFTRRLSLVRHMRLHVRDKTADVDMKLRHSKRTFKCAECGKKFHTKILLAKHLQKHVHDH